MQLVTDILCCEDGHALRTVGAAGDHSFGGEEGRVDRGPEFLHHGLLVCFGKPACAFGVIRHHANLSWQALWYAALCRPNRYRPSL